MAAPDRPLLPGQTRAIERTVTAIAEALPPAKRDRFLAETSQAEDGALDAVLDHWWPDAMLDQVPGRERRVDDALAGRGLVSLDDLAERRRR
ncbi:motile sperm domain-containing protein [Actinomadura rupiterrae]|uniref:motile sperm domain-containing protein n=1 Tax=Actinomadura rupiterrae TaxID=559627 RepID=UPI0020A2E36B|nr:motile sperm domain-containing protein [Actinomadura rupiterrae]MCP2335964.1 hypothetical protein [Actinomadura rupiterrae]